MTTRMDRLKNLMKDRTTVEQGLTLRQMFNQVYDDKKYDKGKFRYLKRVIKGLRKTDEFRWLSIMPVKRNEVNKYGKKVRPYIEHRYININAGKTPELLEEANKIWLKHAEACLKGVENSQASLERIASIPEEQMKQSQKQFADWFDYEIRVCIVLEDRSLKKMIEELKAEDKLPKLYVYDPKRMDKIFKNELLNKAQRHNPSLPNWEELRQTVKDIIVCYCNKKRL
jgi:hypothetical protein